MSKLRYNFVFTLLTCAAASLNAQVFNQMYNTTVDRTSRDVCRTVNGEYLIVGMTNTSKATDSDLYVIRTDANGQMLWDTAYRAGAAERPDYAYSMVETDDNNFIVVGYTQSSGPGDHDIYILKLDPKGKKIGERVVDFGGKNEEARQIIRTNDNKYLVIGSSGFNSTSSKSDMVLLHINGDLSDTTPPRFFGDPSNHEFGLSVSMVPDGSAYFIAGQTLSKGDAVGDAYVIKLKADLTTTDWEHTYGRAGDAEEVVGIVARADGGAMLAIRDSLPGNTQDGNIDIWLQRIDVSGSTASYVAHFYGGADKDTPKSIMPVSTGGYIVGAISRSDWMGFPQQYILRTDDNGSVYTAGGWIRSFGEYYEHDHCHMIKESHDGGFLMVGHGRRGVMKVVFMKLDGLGAVGIDEKDFATNGIALFPNPSSADVNIRFGESGTYQVSVADLTGRLISSNSYVVGTGEVIRSEVNLPAGIYIVNVNGEKLNASAKLMVSE